MVSTLVYAKCAVVERLLLCEDIYYICQNMNLPWMVGGDFNVIIDVEEKIGGLPVYPNEVEVFFFCICSCELIDLNFKGSPLTW